MLRIVLFVLFPLLFVGCDYFDDSDEMANPVVDSTPVVIPVDADWELIATLQRNPLAPGEFYIFPEQNEAINTAYLEGRHFIFEIGREPRASYTNVIRHYIIQPKPPFLDEDKGALQLHDEASTGVEFANHLYVFVSAGWYEPVENLIGGGGQAIGLGVQFDMTHFKPAGGFVGEGTVHSTKIGLISQLNTPVVGRGRSFIKDWIRLRVYVSQ